MLYKRKIRAGLSIVNQSISQMMHQNVKYSKCVQFGGVPEDSLSAGTGVDTGVRDSDGPGGVPDGHLHVLLVS